jgi:hypothetical protein
LAVGETWWFRAGGHYPYYEKPSQPAPPFEKGGWGDLSRKLAPGARRPGAAVRAQPQPQAEPLRGRGVAPQVTNATNKDLNRGSARNQESMTMAVETFISRESVGRLFKELLRIRSSREKELTRLADEFVDPMELARFYVEPHLQDRNPAVTFRSIRGSLSRPIKGKMRG